MKLNPSAKVFLHHASYSSAQESTGINYDDNILDAYSKLNNLRVANVNRIILAHININSLRNKFSMLSDMVVDKMDVLLISETKLDDSFNVTDFFLKGFAKPFRKDRNSNGGGILFYVRNDIPTKELKYIPLPDDIECFVIQINFHKNKWMI